ncbi:leucyl-tRNA synthetase [Powellomyces hirtus]|nr:leucyl-tRNA synthetase [Powellomyces hirtus]
MFTLKRTVRLPGCRISHRQKVGYHTSGCCLAVRLPPTTPIAYDANAVERKWIGQPFLGSQPTDEHKKKFYVLSMFPYPSGTLHMGHVRIYTIADVIARFKKLQGFNVIHPMGWDSFGLPAENAAIDNGVHPGDWTQTNIAKMKVQMESMGTAYDWSRELSTCDPSYYRWTQKLFLDLYKEGLIYQKEALVNWDPVDQTVLANEQVDANRRAERSGALVEKRFLKQWFIRITDCAEELLNDMEHLDWPQNVKRLQTNWIGKTEGLEVDLDLDTDLDLEGHNISTLSAFAVDMETIRHAEYIAVGVDHPILASRGLRKPWLDRVVALKEAFIYASPGPVTMEGAFTGVTAKHPVHQTNLPIYLADYVEPGGVAVFGAPMCNKRDLAFAVEHGLSTEGDPTRRPLDEYMSGMIEYGVGRLKTHYRLRDWLISRQRYWGTPIPIIHCNDCGAVPVPDDELPAMFPDNVSITARGHPLTSNPEWSKCRCPKCNSTEARRDPDTMDTFVDSAWYWLRYCDPKSVTELASPTLAKTMLPVDIYVGGVEHSIMHLLYARFFAKFLHKKGVVDLPHGEPFQKLLTQGMVQGRTYREPGSERYLRREEVDISDPANPKIKATGLSPLVSWEKMSKSKHNGVDPAEILDKHGSDATRLYVLYKAAPADELAWDESAIVGMERWLTKVWKLAMDVASAQTNKREQPLSNIEKELMVSTHTSIQEVTSALNTTYGFHVAIASLIKLTHAMESFSSAAPTSHSSPAFVDATSSLVRMIAPFAPCIAQELWLHLSRQNQSVYEAGWPIADEQVVCSKGVVCAIMVNGKTRGTITVPITALEDTALLESLARESDAGRKWLTNAKTGKAKVVSRVLVGRAQKAGKGRVISFVAK